MNKDYSKQELRKLLKIAENAAFLSAKVLLKDSYKLRKVKQSFRRDIKISADRQSEKIIIGYLSKKTPFSILSEERGLLRRSRSAQETRWIIDPLDGTLNFFRKIPVCCVSIGLWQGNEPLLGVIYDFNTHQLYSAITKIGAWLNGCNINTSDIARKTEAVLLTGFPNKTDFSKTTLSGFVNNIRSYKKIRLLGSAALSLAYVASGKADIYCENDIKIWDIAAGAALVLASGGKIYIKRTLNKNTYSICATNRFLKPPHK